MDKTKKLLMAMLATSAISMGVAAPAQAIDFGAMLGQAASRVVDNAVWNAGYSVQRKVSNGIEGVVNGSNDNQTQQVQYNQNIAYDETKYIQSMSRLDPASMAQLTVGVLSMHDAMSDGRAGDMEQGKYDLSNLARNSNKNLAIAASMAMDTITNGSFNQVMEMTAVTESVAKTTYPDRYVSMLVNGAKTPAQVQMVSNLLVDGFATDHLPLDQASNSLQNAINQTTRATAPEINAALSMAKDLNTAQQNMISKMTPGDNIKGQVLDSGVPGMGNMIVVKTDDFGIIGVNPDSLVSDRGSKVQLSEGANYQFQGTSTGQIMAKEQRNVALSQGYGR